MGDSFSVLTWNILFGGEDRFDAVLEMLSNTGADIVVLQECLEWDQNTRLAAAAEALGVDHSYLGLARPRGSGRRFHVALLSRFTIAGARTHADPENVGHAIVDARIEVPGGELRLLGTHFDAKGEDERVRDATTLIGAAPATGFTVLAGDLNALSVRDPYPNELDDLLTRAGVNKYSTPARFDTMPLLEEAGYIDLLYHDRTPDRWITAERHRGGVHIDYRTDYILGSPAMAHLLRDIEVLDCLGTSDHEPVIATFGALRPNLDALCEVITAGDPKPSREEVLELLEHVLFTPQPRGGRDSWGCFLDGIITEVETRNGLMLFCHDWVGMTERVTSAFDDALFGRPAIPVPGVDD